MCSFLFAFHSNYGRICIHFGDINVKEWPDLENRVRVCSRSSEMAPFDVALLAEMLSVLVLALEVMNEEAQPLGLTINWAKTKIQTTDVTVPPGTTV